MPLIFPEAFPCLPGSKRPAVRWSDPESCRASNGFGPEDVFGLPTGPRNGVWVLDIDRKDGKDGLAALQAYASGRGIEDTYTVRTPSGGLHLYFTWDPERPVGNRAGVLEGVDVRGHGGFVCAGGPYTVVSDVPPVPAPDWMYELVGTREEVTPGASAVAIDATHPEWAYRVATAQAFIAGEPPCISGQGGQAQLWKMALRLMRTYELPTETALELLGPYNTRCVPPWTAQEVSRTLARAAEHGTGPTGMLPQGFGAAPEKSAAALPVSLEGTGDWRRRPDPSHAYGFDMPAEVAGSFAQQVPYGAKELAAVFAGPHASPEWRGVWQYDIFRRRVIAVNPPFRLDAETIGVSARDVAKMQVWCACRGIKAPLESIASALDVAAALAEFHPVRDYLEGLPQKSAAEAEAYFQGIAARLWGASPERDALESAALRRLAVAAVRRIRRPGEPVQVMLILAGAQGYRKSRFCAHLFGEFFRDQMPDLTSKDASIALEGYWGVEMAEMVAFSRAATATQKEFLTRCEDKYRPVWGKATMVMARQCVFIGTTNEDDFFIDPTGNSRFDVCEVRNPIDLTFSRDEFWACAAALESAGETHYRDRAEKSAERSAEEERHAFEHPWTDAVLRYAGSCGKEYVTAAQCLTYGVPVPLDRQDDKHLRVVRNILRKAFGAAHVQWIEGRAQRCYRVQKP